jgi:NADPH:quinone reductase-like Zn-dependent oxidoreductase
MISDRQKTMRAIVQHRYGTEAELVLQLEELARPAVGDDEVLVRVAAASVDMGTWHCMTGMPYAMRLMGFGVRSPKASNPGRAFAGTVESVGRGVTEFKPGDEVYGTCDGSFAEYARVETNMLATKPANLSFEQARGRPHLWRHRATGRPQGERAARAEGVDRRCLGRRRHVRCADRQGVRR